MENFSSGSSFFSLQGHRFVLVNGVLSEPAPVLRCPSRVYYETPLVFLVLIGDIEKKVSHAFIASFADDTKLLCEVKNVSDASSLRSNLEAVYEWATENNSFFKNKKFEAPMLR